MQRVLILVFLTFLGVKAPCDTLVIFIPSPDEAHRALFGTYYHTAVRVGGEWWEAHPYHGVRKTRELGKLRGWPGVKTLRSSKNISPPNMKDLVKLLGTPFDIHSKWGDPESFNCTELVAFVLGVHHYAVPIVEEGFRVGELGLSPDRLYNMLLGDGWTPDITHSDICQDVLLY